jgi:hypothetical protein
MGRNEEEFYRMAQGAAENCVITLKFSLIERKLLAFCLYRQIPLFPSPSMESQSLTLIQNTGSAESLLKALQDAGDATVLLLDVGQSLKPGAAPHLMQALKSGGLYFCPASPHPGLDLGGYGRWLMALRRPPFSMGNLSEASAWGLAGPAPQLATTLSQAIQSASDEKDWHIVLWAQLTANNIPVTPLESAWIFQERLPSLDQLLANERLRGKSLRRLKEAGAKGFAAVPAPIRDGMTATPQAMADAGQALAAVPLAPLVETQVSGLPAADLVRVLTQSTLVRLLAMAYAEGWHDKGVQAPWVSKPIQRIAVVYPIYGGSLNLAQRSAQALERLGYEVTRIDPSRHHNEVTRCNNNPKETDRVLQRIEQECLRDIAAAKPQAMWVLAQAPLGLGTLDTLRRQGLLTAFWFCEDYRVRKGWKNLIQVVDAFFPIQGGDFLPALRAAGAVEMPVLPMAAASDACTESAPAQAHRLSFFGAPYANRVSFFEALTDLEPELYGEGWATSATPLLKPLVKNSDRLTESQGFDIFRNSSININLHSSPFQHGIDPEGDYLNPRTFEIAACGGFQLVDRRRDLATSFVDGEEIVSFNSVAELREQIARWMADPQGRQQIAEAGRRRVQAEHTYEHRLATACKAMGLSPLARP